MLGLSQPLERPKVERFCALQSVSFCCFLLVFEPSSPPPGSEASWSRDWLAEKGLGGFREKNQPRGTSRLAPGTSLRAT